MNYLTNYYKNLSEQLQEKINLLESQLVQVNEDLEPGTIVQGYGSSNTSTTTNQNDSPELNSFLQAWGSSDPTYDYNGDGVVDGNDLGIFLSRSLDRSRPSSPARIASTALQGTPGIETPSTPAGGSKQMRALDQPGTAKPPFPGTYNAGAGAQTPRNVTGKPTQKKGSGANLGQETVIGTPNAPRPKSPTQVGYGDEVTNVLRNKVKTPSYLPGNFTTKAGTNPPTNTLNYNVDGDQEGLVDDNDLTLLRDFVRLGINQDDPEWDGYYSAFDFNGNGTIDQGDYDILYGIIYPPQAVRQMKTTDAGLENVEFRGRSAQRRKK